MNHTAPGLYVADAGFLAPRVDDPQYVTRLQEICRAETVGAVVPLIDKELPFLSRAAHEFEAAGTRVLVAARPLPGSPVRRLLSYEAGPTARYGHLPFVPNVYVDIAAFLGKKLEAIKCYRTELREPPHPRSLAGLELIAWERGQSVGLKAAECFQLIREVRTDTAVRDVRNGVA
jgi:LmbE family N-acetylglucosaminyl deacetylase